MSDVFDYAKYFIKLNLDTNRDTFDGNMKLQKLLVFADLLSLAERNERLFDNDILAFEYGCVIEDVRHRYKNDCYGLVSDSKSFKPNFSQEEQKILDLTVELFGKLSARELSDINHAFLFWYTAYKNSIEASGYKNKSKAVISIDAMRDELDKVKEMIAAYRDTQNDNQSKEIINDVIFYFSPESLTLTEEVLARLYQFSLEADDKAYSIYLDNGRLVIY